MRSESFNCIHIIYIVFCSWNEWLQLPVKFSNLPRNAVLALTIWDIEGTFRAVPVGGTCIKLFSKRGSVYAFYTFNYYCYLLSFPHFSGFCLVASRIFKKFGIVSVASLPNYTKYSAFLCLLLVVLILHVYMCV